MQSSETLSYKIAGFMERRSGSLILSMIVITALLIIPVLTMAPDENASENPGGEVFDLQDDIEERFPPAVHSAGIIVEARGEDVLTQKALLELYQNTERLRQADQAAELAPPGLEAQSFLFSFYFAEIERLVKGTQIPHLRLLGWLLWAYSRCGVSTGVLIGLCAASLRGLATVSHQLWSLSG